MTPERIAELRKEYFFDYPCPVVEVSINLIRELLTALEAVTRERDAAASINRGLVRRCGQMRKAIEDALPILTHGESFTDEHRLRVRERLQATSSDIPDVELACSECKRLAQKLKTWEWAVGVKDKRLLDFTDHITELSEECERLRAAELIWRELLWIAHSQGRGYGDDGEMQFQLIDYKRMSAAEIQAAIIKRNCAALASKPTPTRAEPPNAK